MQDWLRQKLSAMHPVTRIVEIDSVPSLLCKLHPAAEGVVLSPMPPKQLVASANTTTVGPGYHVFLTSLLKEFAQQFGASWEVPSDEYGDETGYFFAEDFDRLHREMTAWLAGLAETFFDGTFDSDCNGIALCLPMNPQFESSQLAITALGPRDREWLRRTAADGNRGADFFSWWQPGFTAPDYLGRALAQMWTDVRWRFPVNEQEEFVLSGVANCLKSAYELDPNLDYPWAEWILETNRQQEASIVNERAHGAPSIALQTVAKVLSFVRKQDAGFRKIGLWMVYSLGV
jgi:hypothetical protein